MSSVNEGFSIFLLQDTKNRPVGNGSDKSDTEVRFYSIKYLYLVRFSVYINELFLDSSESPVSVITPLLLRRVICKFHFVIRYFRIFQLFTYFMAIDK